jgi:uncharacterized protein (TIGR02996 family)
LDPANGLTASRRAWRLAKEGAMSADEPFLRAIGDCPEEPSVRLIYADWLEERGDRRAEFLRLLHQRATATARLEQILPELDPEWVRRVCPAWATDVQMVPVPAALPRVETGAVQFGNDWPGLFLRGDNALSLGVCIRLLCELLADHPDDMVADRLDQLKAYADLIEQKVRA